ncbi:MAG: YARHG domain-containing protein [Faecalimonas sp.]|nr:YARHG domain-containing protein [Faecalimonas sp.]
MEQRFNQIYTKTYNYVYLRAKSILKKESDIQQLMQEVYLKMLATPEAMRQEVMYEWLGKTVYAVGCGYYRKKQTREADCLEMEEQELNLSKRAETEESANVIESHLEDLPDLYQATLYAFYYDYMTIEDIARMMDVPVGVIITRLNYARKYMLQALEAYHDDTKVDVSFTVGSMRAALRKWSVDHCMGVTVAQSVYSEICANANLKPSAIEIEGKEFAGVNHTVVYYKADDWQPIIEQVELYSKKPSGDKKFWGLLLGGVAAIVLLVVLVVGILHNKKTDDLVSDYVPPKNEENVADDVEETPEEEPVQDAATDAAEYILADSATRKLTRTDLEPLSKEELRLARNEIFARHGMIFGVEDLDTYFRSKSWYEPKYSGDAFDEQVQMSMIEEENIALIVAVEDER